MDAGGRVTLAREAEQALLRVDWPGNLRQLDNVVRRAYALALVARRDDGGDLSVGGGDVERALAFEQTSAQETRPLMESLRRAADDFIEHALLLRAAGKPFYMEHAEALGGLVLEAGVRRLGDLREVYRLLGGDAVVKSRNHNREFRRELAKVSRLEEALDSSTGADDGPRPAGNPAIP